MGRPEFETVVASAPREVMKVTDMSSTTILPPNNVESLLLYAPSGLIGEIINLKANCPVPTGAISGNHYLNAGYYGYPMLSGKSNFNNDLIFSYAYWRQADNSQLPPTPEAQIAAMRSIYFDDIVPFEFFYSNVTNVNQSNKRTLVAIYKLRQVSK